jgi:glycosyltransferase involved in cell wall biosynthesis
MRILFTVYNPNDCGSMMATTRRQAEFLASKGHAITVVSNEFPKAWHGVEFIEAQTPDTSCWTFAKYVVNGIGRRLPLSWAFWDFRKFLPQYRFSCAIVEEISKHRDCHSVDGIVCCQHFCAPGLVRIQEDRGIPFLLVAHGDIFSHPDESFPRPLRRLYRRTAEISYQKALHVISVSSRLGERAQEMGTPPDSVSVIPNGIDYEELFGEECCSVIRKADCQLLFVGRLAPEKAVDVLIQAMAVLRSHSIHLRVIGDGPCRQQLEQLVADLDLSTAVEFVGHVKRDCLGGYYRQSDIVVLPSLTEAQPVVTLESLLTGRPIIATNVGGIPDVVRHNWNGLLVPPGDFRSLADAIEKLSLDSSLRERLGDNAYSLAPKFSWQQVLESFGTEITRAFCVKHETINE